MLDSWYQQMSETREQIVSDVKSMLDEQLEEALKAANEEGKKAPFWSLEHISERIGHAMGFFTGEVVDTLVEYVLPPLIDTLSGLAEGFWKGMSEVEIDDKKVKDSMKKFLTVFQEGLSEVAGAWK
jgi:hypothetical protein